MNCSSNYKTSNINNRNIVKVLKNEKNEEIQQYNTCQLFFLKLRLLKQLLKRTHFTQAVRRNKAGTVLLDSTSEIEVEVAEPIS